MDKKFLVTGGAGFIGSCFIRYLNDLGIEDIFVVDDLKDLQKEKNLENKKFLDFISKNDLFIFLKDKKNLSVVHLGACSDTLEKDVKYLLENNFLYTVNLAQICLKKGFRFLYASSAATYGLGEKGFLEKEIEDLRPINMYAYSKYLFDLWAKKNKILDKITGLKYFNVFGPNEYHKEHMASMVFKMMKRAKMGKSIKLFKSFDPKYQDGEQKRDFIYVKDAVKITYLLLEKNLFGLFNVGSAKAVSWNVLAKSLFLSLKKTPIIEYINMPFSLQKQYQNYTKADMRKFKGFFPNFKFLKVEDSVKDYVQNYLMKGNKVW